MNQNIFGWSRYQPKTGCKSFPFFFRLIPRSTEKIIDLFLIIGFLFHFNKEIDHSYSYIQRIIFYFWRRRNAYDVTILFSCWWKTTFNCLPNQNKRYAITLINIKWFLIPIYADLTIRIIRISISFNNLYIF